MRNKKANINDIAIAMVIIFAMSIVFVAVKYSYGVFVDTAINNTMFNQSESAVSSLQTTRDMTSRFDYIVFVLLMGFTLVIIIGAWFSAGNPIFSFLYFIALIILIILSAIFSFVWEQVSTREIFIETVSTLPIIDLILTHFPIYITILGFIGMAIIFAKPQYGS